MQLAQEPDGAVMEVSWPRESGADHTVTELAFTSAAGWHPATPVPGATETTRFGTPSVISRDSTRLELYIPRANGEIRKVTWID